MTIPKQIQDNKPITKISNIFHHFVGGFVINLPCIITDNNTVFVHDTYTLVDFTDTNGGYIERRVQFFDAYLRRYVVTVMVMDLEFGEFIKRSHRLNNDDLPCNWVLTDLFDPKDKDDLLEFCF